VNFAIKGSKSAYLRDIIIQSTIMNWLISFISTGLPELGAVSKTGAYLLVLDFWVKA